MFRYEKFYVSPDVEAREALCKKLTDNGATLVTTAGEQDVIHIFHSFEGGLFEECVKKACRVFGVPCVQESLRTGRGLPRAAHPVYSRIMEGLVVAGETEDKAKIKNLVNYMGGIWMDEIGVGTQYFVTNEPGSLHYTWALELGAHIVQPSWVTESWTTQLLADYKTHLLPPLSGCTISVTGLSPGTRASIQHLVTHYGGKYSQQLSRRVTHLLCDKPKGRKYVTALSWGIYIVSTSWLFDSINAKGTADVSRYELPSLPMGSDLDGDGMYMRSPYSRSGPYNPLTSSGSRRLNYTAPILVRRHRTSMGTNYTPIFPLPPAHTSHMHAPSSSHSHLPVFAQTTQIQSGSSSHHNNAMMSSLQRQQSLTSFSQQKSQTSSSRSSREGRTNMDRYRDLFDQLTGMLRMCDDLIEKCAHANITQPIPPPIGIAPTTTTTTTTYKNNDNISNTVITNTNNEPITNTETTTTSSDTATSNTNTTSIEHPTEAPTALPPPPTTTQVTDDNADIDMDSDDDVTTVSTETTSSEEK